MKWISQMQTCSYCQTEWVLYQESEKMNRWRRWRRAWQREKPRLLHSHFSVTSDLEKLQRGMTISPGSARPGMARLFKWATEQILFWPASLQRGPLYSSDHCLSFLCFTDRPRGVNRGQQRLHKLILQSDGEKSWRQDLCCTTVSRQIFLCASGSLVWVKR